MTVGTPCLRAGILVARAPVRSLGPLVCDPCFAVADGGRLSLESGPALGLVALTLKHCCLQTTVHYSSRVPALLRLFILGRFLCFLGDEACAALAPASVIPEGPRACFVVQVLKGGWGAWEFPAGAVTTQCQNRCHVTLLCHIFFFLKPGFCGSFKIGPCFIHETGIMKKVNSGSPSERL